MEQGRLHRLRSAILRVVMLLVALSFAGSILGDIRRYGVDIPYWDQWDIIAVLRRLSSGEDSWPGILLLNASGHQVWVQFVLTVLVWNLTQMNMVSTMVLNWSLAVGFCALGMWITRKALPPGEIAPWIVLATASFYVFHPAAYQLWFWGIFLVYLPIPLLYFAGIAVAQSRASDRIKILAAAACAFLASFILGSGLLLWLLFPYVLALYLEPNALKTERLALLLSGILGAGCLIIYAMGARNYQSPAPANGPSGPVALVEFFFAYTGNLVALSAEAPPVLWAEIMGFGLTCLFVTLVLLAFHQFYGKSEWRLMAVWAGLGVYSLAAGALVALGRHGFGLAYAVESSRYVLASAFLPVATVALACLLIRAYASSLPSNRRLYYGTICATTVVLLMSAGFRYLQWPRAVAMMRNSHFSQTAGKLAVASANVFPLPYLGSVFAQGTKEDFLRSANFLNSRGWLHPPMWDRAFLSKLASPQRRLEPAYGMVDTFKLVGGLQHLSGWAYLSDRNARADAVIVLARESGSSARVLAVVLPSIPRQDVFERLREPESLSSGWKAEILADPGTVVRCFAYDARTGDAHLLPGLGSGE